MKNPLLLLLCFAALAARLPAQPGADRFAGLKAKIDVLLNPRLNPDTLPDKPANPFKFVVTGLPLDTLPEATQPIPPPSTTSRSWPTPWLAFASAVWWSAEVSPIC